MIQTPPPPASQQPHQTESDRLVGRLILEWLLAKHEQVLTDSFSEGAFEVLSGFTAAQLSALAAEIDNAPARTEKLSLILPETALVGAGIDSRFLSPMSAVDIRNDVDRDGKIVVTAEIESDAGASLADSGRTEVADLKDRSMARLWVETVEKQLAGALGDAARAWAVAMLSGLFERRAFSLSKTGEYLRATLSLCLEGDTLLHAAGKSLPKLGLPLYENCFSSLTGSKETQPAAWREAFRKHQQTESYLQRREPGKQEPIDVERCRERLATLREEDVPPSSTLLQAFSDYIESKQHDRATSEALLFAFDWSDVRGLFEVSRKASATDFVQRTRDALALNGSELTSDDELVLVALKAEARRPGTAQESYREFFERFEEAIEGAPGSLYLEWEDFVRGKRVDCKDLLEGIIACVQRVVKARDNQRECYFLLEGKRQQKPSSFADKNEAACTFFQRCFGGLPEATGRKVRFDPKSLAPRYLEDVLPKLPPATRAKRLSASKSARTLEFQVHVYEILGPDDETEIATLALSWEYSLGSILSGEVQDFDVLVRLLDSNKKTALAACAASYEPVGRKGVPPNLALDRVAGLANGGRLIPALSKCFSLAGEWRRIVDDARATQKIAADQADSLEARFATFDRIYGQSIRELAASRLITGRSGEVSGAYGALLHQIRATEHEETQRRLLRVLLGIGSATLDRTGLRPAAMIVAPWHPLRIEAAAARKSQILGAIETLLSKGAPPFSDGRVGSLFFKDLWELSGYVRYPELVLGWQGTQAIPMIAIQGLGDYTLHLPLAAKDTARVQAEDGVKASAETIVSEIQEYLRLQPHEHDNLSLLLYDCDSAELPLEVVGRINALNARDRENQITCQIFLMHRDDKKLRAVYQELVARSADSGDDPTEATGDFLARVRVSLTAASRLANHSRSKPIDIAYCRDLMSAESEVEWKNIPRETRTATSLQPHRWSRRLAIAEGDRSVRVLVVCPAHTESAWAFMMAVALGCGKDEDSWESDKCPVPVKILDFDAQGVNRIFRQTHDLATWVVSQDELLDRRLLQAQHVKVIRYVQSSTHGRNLIISSDARDTLLVNSVEKKVLDLLPTGTDDSVVSDLRQRIIAEANGISGGLLLRAARRSNNTNELFGIVLSKFLVQCELGQDRPIALCFFDDYAQWLGKKEGASLADLLILAPFTKPDGTLHLDVVVTEAKFSKLEGLSTACNSSRKQLDDTLSQLSEALGSSPRIDRELWLARLSDLLILQLDRHSSSIELDPGTWRKAIRQQECTIRVWGYSHVFVYGPDDAPNNISTTRGLTINGGEPDVLALQEVFGPKLVRELLLNMHSGDCVATRKLRSLNGHAWLDSSAPPSRTPADSSGDSNSARIGDLEAVAPSAVPADQVEFQREELAGIVEGGPSEEHAPIISYLLRESGKDRVSDQGGELWLNQMTQHLRQELTARGVPARLAPETEPILTPNAGIVKLQGSKDTTVAAVESRSAEIFTSSGLKIINVLPEPARISISIERPERQTLFTEPILLDYLREYKTGKLGERLLVGIKEEDGRPILLDPYNQPHTLVAGITGSGKSVLMQNLIMSIAASRSPDEALIYLIDPKFGVDYRPLDELLHVERGSGGVVDDMTVAIEMLGGLVEEMNRRYQMFRAAKVPHVQAYRRATGDTLPSIWVIHDEFADWMHTPQYKSAMPDIVGRLSVKARAAGIFLIFAAQRPDKDVMPLQLRSQLGNRLILKVDNAGTSEIAVGEKNAGAERLLGRGHMLAKTGDTPNPIYAQVPYFDVERNGAEFVRAVNEGW